MKAQKATIGLFLLMTFGCLSLILAITPNVDAVPELGKKKIPIGAGENIIAAGNWNHDKGASSDITLIIRLDVNGKTVVDEGHKVKYIVNKPGDKGPKDWFESDFDDSKWEDGEASVGYGDPDDWTVVPEGGARQVASIYTRYRFKLSGPFKQVDMYIDWDDFYLVTMNGVEVARDTGLNGQVGQPKFPDGNHQLGGGHGASELPKGKPNKARWAHPKIDKLEKLQFTVVNLAVEPTGKLATSWGRIKAGY
jgi:hypothetical protein